MQQFLNRLTGQGLSGQDHFESVVVGRIVTAGDHDAAIGFEMISGEVSHRRDDEADVDDVATGFLNSLCQRRGKGGSGKASVMADDNVLWIFESYFVTD